jgi:hypothetical protein
MVLISGCLMRSKGTSVSRYTYDESYQLNIPVKDGDCYEASVFLSSDIKKAKKIANKVLLTNPSAEIIEETDAYLQVSMHRAMYTVTLKEIESNKTFVTIANEILYVAGADNPVDACTVINLIVQLSKNDKT